MLPDRLLTRPFLHRFLDNDVMSPDADRHETLLPGLSNRVASTWLASERAYAIPPVWFLGLYEALAASALDGLPRGDLPRRVAESERMATDLYRSQRDVLRPHSVTAVGALFAAVGARRGASGPRHPAPRPERMRVSWLPRTTPPDCRPGPPAGSAYPRGPRQSDCETASLPAASQQHARQGP